MGGGGHAGSPMSLGASAARGTGIVLATQALRAVLQFGSMIVLANLLSPTDFGLVAMVTAVIGIADLVRDFGLSSAAVQAKDVTAAERTNLFWANLGLGGACTAIVVLCAPLIERVYHTPGLIPIVLALSGIFTLSGANTQYRADLTRSMRYGALASSDVFSQVAGIAVAISLAANGYGPWAIVAQQLVVAVVALAMNVWSTRWCPGWYRRGVSLRRFFSFGGSLFATQTLTYVTKNIDNIALGVYSGAYQLGLYSRAYQLLMTPLNQINAPMTGVALPVLSKIQDDGARFNHYLERAQLVASYLTASVLAVAAGLAYPLTLLLFGEKWVAIAPIFAVLALGGIFRSIQQVAYWAYLARGKTGAQLRMILATRPLMIVMIVAGVYWGPIGVAVGHSVGYFLFWLVSMWHVGKAADVDSGRLIRNGLLAVCLVCFPAGLVAYATTLIPLPPWLAVLVGTTAAVLYAALVALVVPRVRSDVKVLWLQVKRAVGRAR